MSHSSDCRQNRASRKPIKSISCPVECTIALIGGKHKAMILWQLAGQTLRFSQLRRLLPQATAKMLTQQLRELEADGLVLRRVFAVIPPKVEYSLSELGRGLQPLLEALYQWGSKFMAQRGLEPNCPMKRRGETDPVVN